MTTTSESVHKVAFLGLGKMGAPIANNLLEAGFDLTVCNRTPAKMVPLVEKGACGMATPREASSGADVVFTCLMDDQSMFDFVNGADGLLAGLRPGGMHVGMATISPGYAATLARLHQEHGSAYIAGPIFGRPNVAAREFDPAFDLRAGFKDVELMLQASSEVQAWLSPASSKINFCPPWRMVWRKKIGAQSMR